MSATVKQNLVDGAAVTAVISNLAGLITGVTAAIAGVLTVVWAVIRVYEMETVQLHLPRRLRLPRYRA